MAFWQPVATSHVKDLVKAEKKSSNVCQIPEWHRRKTPYQQKLPVLGQRIFLLPGKGQALALNTAAATQEPMFSASSRQDWNNAGNENYRLHRPSPPQKPEEHGRNSKRRVLLRILSLVKVQEVEFSRLLLKDLASREDLEKVAEHRTVLLGHYQRVILSDIRFSEVQKVSQLLWKNVFHQVIERFGQLLKHQNTVNSEHIHHRLLAILDEGTAFFESLLRQLQKRYRFRLTDHLERSSLGNKLLEEPLKSALTCAQKTMIYLGDLARYCEQAKTTTNFRKAQRWYLQAHQLDPSDGYPYNQLALLAMYTKRKLDAVCYFMRSLSSVRPSVSSEKNLTKLFEVHKCKAVERDKLAIFSLGPGDLLQSFIRSFLQVHGQLFTGVEMESFPAGADELLMKFQLLLQKNPTAMGNHQMLNLMIINIFSVYNSTKKQSSPEPGSPLIQRKAMALALAMLSLLVSYCTYWLQQCPRAPAEWLAEEEEEKEKPSQILVSSFNPVLKALLPSVKIGCQWMLLFRPTCTHSPAPLMFYQEVSRDLWGTLTQFKQSLRMVNISEVPLYGKPGNGLTLLILEEDQFFSDFAPLLGILRDPCYMKTNSDKVIAGNCRRVHVLKNLLEVLSGHVKSLLESEDGQGRAIQAPITDSNKKEVGRQQQRNLGVKEELKEFPGNCLQEDGGALGSHLSMLKAKKLMLAKKIKEEQQHQKKIKAILQSLAQPRQMQEEIRVSFLVLDTNSFLQHLENLSKLLKERKYIFLVPLIVIHELKGLSKRHQGDLKTGSQTWELQLWAQKSLDFLEQQFQQRNPYLKVLSSQGKELDTTTYDKRDIFSQGNYDDYILCCCLNYQRAQTKNNIPPNKNEQIQLHAYSLVLLTDDRTLRVKALASNVPVWDNETFIKEVKQLQHQKKRKQQQQQKKKNLLHPPPFPPPTQGKEHQAQKRFRSESGVFSG